MVSEKMFSKFNLDKELIESGATAMGLIATKEDLLKAQEQAFKIFDKNIASFTRPIIQRIADVLLEKIPEGDVRKVVAGKFEEGVVAQAITWQSNRILFGSSCLIEIPLETISTTGYTPKEFAFFVSNLWGSPNYECSDNGLAILHPFWEDNNHGQNPKFILEIVPPQD